MFVLCICFSFILYHCLIRCLYIALFSFPAFFLFVFCSRIYTQMLSHISDLLHYNLIMSNLIELNSVLCHRTNIKVCALFCSIQFNFILNHSIFFNFFVHIILGKIILSVFLSASLWEYRFLSEQEYLN